MFKHYLTTALRHLARHKVTTAINILCLGFGFVCFALALGAVRFSTKADQYHEKAERTYVVTQRSEFLGGEHSFETGTRTGFGLAKHLATDFPDIEIVARAFNPREIPIAAGKELRFADVVYADPELLEVFEFNFIAGDRRNALKAPRSAVITKDLALQLYGRIDVLGESILVANKETVHIRGVVGSQRQPSHISTDSSPGILKFSLLVSVDTLQSISDTRVETAPIAQWIFNGAAITYVVLPKSGALTREALQNQLPAFYKRLYSDDPDALAIFKLRPVSEINAARLDNFIKRDTTGLSQTSALMFIGSLVLILSCLNYSNLAAAQAITRVKELALHRVVGAFRSQLAFQVWAEALLASMIGVVVALAALPFAIQLLKTKIGFDIAPALYPSSAFWLTILLTAIAASLLASFYPAFVAARTPPARALQGGQVPRSKRPLMTALVVAQFAIASLLFVATGVMYAQNDKMLRTTSAGSDPVVRIDNDLRTAGVDANTLKAELSKLPQVKSVSSANVRPGSLNGPIFFALSGPEANARGWFLSAVGMDFDFFKILGVPLLAGRDFDPSVDRYNSAFDADVIIDRALASEYGWSPADAVGKSIYMPGPGPGAPSIPSKVIGVVENAKLLPIVTEGSASTFYRLGPNGSSYFVRLSKDGVAEGLAAIDNTWRKLSPNVALKRSFLDEEYETLYRQVTSVTSVFRITAFLALFIGTLGLIGIATHAIAQRTFEIGVRRTFGASARQVLSMLLKDFSKPILIANVIAWPLAYLAAKAYSSFFADRAPITVTPFVLSLLLGLSIAWLAVLRQATGAARMNPAAVLRHE